MYHYGVPFHNGAGVVGGCTGFELLFSLEPCPENGYPENLDAVLCVAGFFTSPYSQSTHLPS
jgi:hypothetical protein